MKFNLTILEPPDYKHAHFLFDSAKYIAYSLESLGHSCSIKSNYADAGRINILFNAHKADRKTVELLTSGSIRYIVHQGELLTPDGGVNHSGKEHFETCYLPLLRGALDVWDWNSQHVEILSARGVQASILEYGFHSNMEEIRPKTDRDIDLLWYGSITPHRKAMLDRLIRQGMNVVSVFDPVSFYRNDLMARSKIVLALKQDSGHAHVPAGRALYGANNRIFIAGELATTQHWMNSLWSSASAEELPDLLQSLLASTTRNQIADERFEYLRKYPMTEYLAPLVEKLSSN